MSLNKESKSIFFSGWGLNIGDIVGLFHASLTGLSIFLQVALIYFLYNIH